MVASCRGIECHLQGPGNRSELRVKPNTGRFWRKACFSLGQSFTFRHDNNCKHTTKATQVWFKIKNLNCPPPRRIGRKIRIQTFQAERDKSLKTTNCSQMWFYKVLLDILCKSNRTNSNELPFRSKTRTSSTRCPCLQGTEILENYSRLENLVKNLYLHTTRSHLI